MKPQPLTVKQEKFAQLVARGDSYADAYRGAYDVGENTSMNTIYVKSSRLVDESKISLRISELQSKTVKRNEITIDTVITQLGNWLLFDPLSIVDSDTDCVKSLKDMDKRARMSLSEIHVQEIYKGSGEDRIQIGTLKKIKFIDKRATAEMFMKKFKQYAPETTDLSDNLDAIKEIIEAIKK